MVGRSGSKRTLHVLSLTTGKERFRQTFDTPLPLAPCLLEGRIVLRTSPRVLQGFSVGEKALAPRWTFTAKTGVGPATVVRDEAYAVVDGVLSRLTFGAADPVWPRAAGGTPVKVEGVVVPGATAPKGKGPAGPVLEYPRPSVRDRSVFVATGTRLVEVDRQDGSIRREAKLPAAADARTSRVLVGHADVLVCLGAKFTGDGGEADTCRYTLEGGGPFEARRSLLLPIGVACIGRSWVAAVGQGNGQLVLAMWGGGDLTFDPDEALATGERHAEYLSTKVAPTAAGDHVLLAGRVFDADSLEVVRAESVPSVGRSIPLHERVLVTETRGRVTCWRAQRASTPTPPLRLFAAEGSDAALARRGPRGARGRRVVAGAFALDPKTGGLTCAGKPADAGTWPLTAVRALLADGEPRRLLLANRPEDAANAVAAIGRAESLPDVLALVPAAIASGDAALARSVQSLAAECGASPTELGAHEKAVVALEARGGERAEDKAAEVETGLKAVLGKGLDVLVAAAASLPQETPVAYGTALVRAAAERSPYHAGATAWVRGRLPKGLSPKGISDLGEWLDFLDLTADDKVVRIFGPGVPIPDDVPSAVGEALEKARSGWRDDVVGFLNGPLLVVSPPEHPSAITRCLSLGRIVSDALDEAFASLGPKLTEEEILVLHLFPNKTEYLSQGAGGKQAQPGAGWGGLEKSAGHYSPSANVTRIFFPVGDDGDSVLRTYAHELTHNWVARRRPRRTEGESLGDAAGGPGYFIVEGIADFVKDWDYETTPGKALAANPKAEYADIVGGLPTSAVLPWTMILNAPQRQAYALLGESEVKVPLRWRMGPGSRLSKGNVYYAQSSALTAYLYLAEGGKYRPALFTYLYDHYAGSCDPDKLLTTVGCTADELGARVVAWCRATVRGSPADKPADKPGDKPKTPPKTPPKSK